jgi:hypothetical protein
MKTLWIALALVVATAGAAAAYCTSTTIFANGRTQFCTSCCYGGQCTVTCF